MATTVDEDIRNITAEIARTQRTGPPLRDLEQQAIATLDEAAAHFRAHGFTQRGVTTGELAHHNRLSCIGALVTIARDKFVETERARVRAAFNAAGGQGMTPQEKAAKQESLRVRLRQAYARRELEWRKLEAAGQTVDDRYSAADPEAFLRTAEDLAAIASGKELRQ